MSRTPTSLSALALTCLISLLGAGCADGASDDDTARTATSATVTVTGGSRGDTKAGARDAAVRFAECMRDNGISAFPDPDASGELTVDGVLNGSSLDASTPAWKQAIGACKDLQPPGFTGEERSTQEQDGALAFAQCMRDNGIADFPDPVKDGPLVDTTRIPSAAGRGAKDIPGFQTAMDKCTGMFSGELGLEGR